MRSSRASTTCVTRWSRSPCRRRRDRRAGLGGDVVPDVPALSRARAASRPSSWRRAFGEGRSQVAAILVAGERLRDAESRAPVHRLVRLSPFDSAHRRQTSFAQVIVARSSARRRRSRSPTRTSGSTPPRERATLAARQQDRLGGTDPHLPTGIVVQCQNERSQSSNKQTAVVLLSPRLAELAEEEREVELAKELAEAQNTGFGARSAATSPPLPDGQGPPDFHKFRGRQHGRRPRRRLDGFIQAYLLAKAAGKVVKLGC